MRSSWFLSIVRPNSSSVVINLWPAAMLLFSISQTERRRQLPASLLDLKKAKEAVDGEIVVAVRFVKELSSLPPSDL
jgi:hypothetical protein